MIPGVNPRQLKTMMRQMGISQDDIDATEVIIKTPEKIYIFTSPSVQKVVMQGQTSYQIIGEPVIKEPEHNIVISEDDVAMVSEQAGVSKEEARKALDKSKGDIAQAIVDLTP